jgi:hypothetical protein
MDTEELGGFPESEAAEDFLLLRLKRVSSSLIQDSIGAVEQFAERFFTDGHWIGLPPYVTLNQDITENNSIAVAISIQLLS